MPCGPVHGLVNDLIQWMTLNLYILNINYFIVLRTNYFHQYWYGLFIRFCLHLHINQELCVIIIIIIIAIDIRHCQQIFAYDAGHRRCTLLVFISDSAFDIYYYICMHFHRRGKRDLCTPPLATRPSHPLPSPLLMAVLQKGHPIFFCIFGSKNSIFERK